MSNEDSNNIYQNPFTPCKNQRKKLTLPIPELIELDNSGQFKITFCCLLAQYLQENNGLRELLDAVTAYKINDQLDYFKTKSAGYFEHKGIKVFFRERSNSIVLGTLNDSELISKFAEYKYYSLEAVKDF